ncbi:MAG TPA: hypothetical protein DHW63_09380 [Hyphomonadaceae bacterium]|nr:hypothetical protein [Hyphomonadaceae bacterium]
MELFSDAPAPAKPAPLRSTTPRKPVAAVQIIPKGRKAPVARSPSSAETSPAGALLDVRQAAARLGLSKSTLDKMRSRGVGPRFIKSTDRAVRYDPVDLDLWVVERRRQSTEPSS